MFENPEQTAAAIAIPIVADFPRPLPAVSEIVDLAFVYSLIPSIKVIIALA